MRDCDLFTSEGRRGVYSMGAMQDPEGGGGNSRAGGLFALESKRDTSSFIGEMMCIKRISREHRCLEVERREDR